MTFRLTDFASVSITQVLDIRTTGNRYKRSRVEGNKKPYWMIELTTSPLPYAQGMAAAAYLDSLKGSLEIIKLPVPLPNLVNRSGLTNTSADDAGDKVASINGFSNNLNNAVLAGDFIQFTNHQKVYRIVNNAASNGSGQLSATITPELFKSTTLNEPVKYGDAVLFQCCLDDYVSMDVSANDSKFVVFNITLVEQG